MAIWWQMEEDAVRHDHNLGKQNERLRAAADDRLAVGALLVVEQTEVRRLRDLLANANSRSMAAELEAT